MQVYADRRDAGKQLAAPLATFAGRSDVIVLALPSGGVPVAYEVAEQLRLPLDVMVVRKLGTPGDEEYALGAIASGGVQVLDPEALDDAGITAQDLDAVIERERAELDRRELAFRGNRRPLEIGGTTVLLIDDGLATGSTMMAAIEAVRARDPERIVVAVPIASAETCAELRWRVDGMVCLSTPEPLYSIGQWYEDFTPTSDDEVRALLDAAARAPAVPDATAVRTAAVRLSIEGATLTGELTVPRGAEAVIVFAHAGGAIRTSPHSRQIADALARHGFATLLFDLLTADETAVDRTTRHHRFDIPLLVGRLLGALAWTARRPELARLPVGLFAASTGAAAALIAATRSRVVEAVVARGGRPDLAGDALRAVSCPCLLVVGGDDPDTVALNHEAIGHLAHAPASTIHVVPSAGPLCEEPGAIDEVIHVATLWFRRYLVGAHVAEARVAQARVP